MRNAPFQTIRAAVVTTRCCSNGGPQVNNFEQVTSVGHQMSVAENRF